MGNQFSGDPVAKSGRNDRNHETGIKNPSPKIGTDSNDELGDDVPSA